MRYVRAVLGIVVLVFLGFTLKGWWGEYETQKAAQAAQEEASATIDASGTVDASGTASSGSKAKTLGYTPATITSGTRVIVVLIDGLNLREKPESDAKALRPLKKDESLTVISERPGWYEARDSEDVQGWVSSNPAYTKVQDR